MTSLSPSAMAKIFAVAFALAGIAGFIPNPLLGPDGLFVTNVAHNFVHLITAALFWYVATRSESAALTFTRVFGVVYLLVGVLGFIVLGGREQGMLLGLVHINQMDNFLHIGLGAAIGAAGFLLRAPGSAREASS